MSSEQPEALTSAPVGKKKNRRLNSVVIVILTGIIIKQTRDQDESRADGSVQLLEYRSQPVTSLQQHP